MIDCRYTLVCSLLSFVLLNTCQYCADAQSKALSMKKFDTYWNTSISSSKGGFMTTYASNPPVSNTACQYGVYWATINGSPWLDPYAKKNNFCGVSSALFQQGKACGRCYRVIYTGEWPGTNPGRPGFTDIQVIDENSASHEFNCALLPFNNITGANTGIFPVTYIPMPCVPTATPRIVVLDGNNEWWVRILVVGGTTGVQSVRMRIMGSQYKLNWNSGATYSQQFPTAQKSVGSTTVLYRVLFQDGTDKVFRCNYIGWPVASGTQCSTT